MARVSKVCIPAGRSPALSLAPSWVGSVFSCLNLLQEPQVEKRNGGAGCQHDFFLPSSKSAPLGHPPMSEIQQGLVGGWLDLGSTVLPGSLVWSTSEAAPASIHSLASQDTQSVPTKDPHPCGAVTSSPMGVFTRSPDSLLTHRLLLLPLVGVTNSIGSGVPNTIRGIWHRGWGGPSAHPACSQAGHRLVKGHRASSPGPFTARRQICMEKLKLAAKTAAARGGGCYNKASITGCRRIN